MCSIVLPRLGWATCNNELCCIDWHGIHHAIKHAAEIGISSYAIPRLYKVQLVTEPKPAGGLVSRSYTKNLFEKRP